MASYDPTKTPLEIAPPGYDNNLIEAPSQAWIPRLAIYTTLPIAFCFTLLRIQARLHMRSGLGLDDYLCITALLASGGFCGVMLEQLLDDMYGRHYWNIPVSSITDKLMQETCAITAAYCVAAALIRVSLLTLFRRLFSPLRRTKSMIWIGIIFTIISHVILFIAWILCSVPLKGDRGWNDPTFFIKVGAQTPKVSVAFGAVGTFTDFYIITIPLTAISSLKLSLGKKIGVSALFATGLLACSFSAAGLATRLDNYRATNVYGTPDPFWTSMPAYGLAIAEVNLGILCACIPVAFPIFKSLAQRCSEVGSSWKRSLLKSEDQSQTLHSNVERDPELQKWGLPEVPRGKPQPLLSFVFRSLGSRAERSSRSVTVTQTFDIEMASDSEIRPSDVDYHRYLGT